MSSHFRSPSLAGGRNRKGYLKLKSVIQYLQSHWICSTFSSTKETLPVPIWDTNILTTLNPFLFVLFAFFRTGFLSIGVDNCTHISWYLFSTSTVSGKIKSSRHISIEIFDSSLNWLHGNFVGSSEIVSLSFVDNWRTNNSRCLSHHARHVFWSWYSLQFKSQRPSHLSSHPSQRQSWMIRSRLLLTRIVNYFKHPRLWTVSSLAHRPYLIDSPNVCNANAVVTLLWLLAALRNWMKAWMI